LSGTGEDSLFGGRGADIIAGGAGDDQLQGGQGADRFVFHAVLSNGVVESDAITDFEIGRDRLDLGARGVTSAVQSGDGLLLTLEGDGDLLLAGVSAPADLQILF